jgi:hypothetical protein
MPCLHLTIDSSRGGQLVLEDPQVVIAGFTGRDRAAVDEHIAELHALGVAAPPEVPTFWSMPSRLLSLAPAVACVPSATTSGEAEPVLICVPSGETYVGAGSDHTDRERERESLEAAKLACPKMLAPSVWRLDDVADHWDELRLLSRTGLDGDPYQRSTLAAVREPGDLLERLRAFGVDWERPLVFYLGTVAVLDGFRFDTRFEAILQDPRSGRELVCAYEVRDLSADADGAATMAKEKR